MFYQWYNKILLKKDFPLFFESSPEEKWHPIARQIDGEIAGFAGFFLIRIPEY